jgi:hypothetical protein
MVRSALRALDALSRAPGAVQASARLAAVLQGVVGASPALAKKYAAVAAERAAAGGADAMDTA